MTGTEIFDGMEHLVALLHKEWERSGRTEAEVSIRLSDRAKVGRRIAAEIRERQGWLESAEPGFEECMALSRENFVFLRLAKKIKKAGDEAVGRGNAASFSVEMDGEEYGLFCTIFDVGEE